MTDAYSVSLLVFLDTDGLVTYKALLAIISLI